MDLDNLMDFAARTATRAGELAMTYFGSTAVEFKGDGSEVTAADRAAEEHILAALREAFPDDGVMGEEGTAVESRSGRRWIVDPIDATRSFASGVPLFGILIALEREGSPVLGCCRLPALGQTLVAARGAGAWLDGRPSRISGCDDLRDARLVTSGLEYWRDWASPDGRAGFESLVERTRFTRTWGDCFGYVLLASGRADLLADPATGAYWDYAPMVPILEEAGARFTRVSGEPVAAWSTALAANPVLHQQATDCWARRTDAELQSDLVRAKR